MRNVSPRTCENVLHLVDSERIQEPCNIDIGNFIAKNRTHQILVCIGTGSQPESQSPKSAQTPSKIPENSLQ